MAEKEKNLSGVALMLSGAVEKENKKIKKMKNSEEKSQETEEKKEPVTEKTILQEEKPIINKQAENVEVPKENKPVKPIQTPQIETPVLEKKRGRPTFSSKGKQNREQVTITLPRPELALAREYAEENGTTLAMICGEALADWVKMKGLK